MQRMWTVLAVALVLFAGHRTPELGERQDDARYTLPQHAEPGTATSRTTRDSLWLPMHPVAGVAFNAPHLPAADPALTHTPPRPGRYACGRVGPRGPPRAF